ncbi:MAG TPA: zinc carboxypeptidase [Leptospiraceae bacterium]|nr:zinc carboxypeptidase [Leptospiraceae bacterium]
MAKLELPAPEKTVTIGKSIQGLDIQLYCSGNGPISALLIGGGHGDEPEGYLFAERFMQEVQTGSLTLPEHLKLYICPRLNPDGCAVDRRTNARNVDLNRNLPTGDWTADFTNPRYFPGLSAGSEIESEITVAMIEAIKPRMIMSLHSYEHAMINYNGDCLDLAEAMARSNGLPPKSDIGYPTPGSLGTYAGWERNIPTITLEILRGQLPDDAYTQHRMAALDGLSFYRS